MILYYFEFVTLKITVLDSRIPTIDIGTPEEDAYRRDLTINSLFYNVNEQKIEDFTGKGITGGNFSLVFRFPSHDHFDM